MDGSPQPPTEVPPAWREPRVGGRVYGDDRASIGLVLQSLAGDLKHEEVLVLRRRRRQRVAAIVLAVLALAGVAWAARVILRPDYRIEHVAADGSPVRWNPCEPVHFVVNPAGAPPHAVRAVRRVAGQVAAATNLRFVFDGTTDEQPRLERSSIQPHRYGRRRAPVLVAWESVGAAGVPLRFKTHARSVTQIRSLEGAPGRFISGQIVVNRDRPTIDPNAPPLDFVLRHEFGHIVGLDHAAHGDEVMYRNVTSANRTKVWGDGDRAGLQRLGRQPGEC